MQHYDRGHGVLVVLHGHDGEPDAARRWGRAVAPPGWEVVAPGAARDDTGVRSWFDRSPRGAVDESMRRALGRLGALVRDLRGPAGRPVVVVGHSQGAALALRLAVTEDRPDGVVALCGFWPETVAEAAGESPVRMAPSLPVLVVTRLDDDVVPPELGRDAGALLTGAGAEVTVIDQAGPHTLDDATVDVVSAWLDRLDADRPMVSLALPVDRAAPVEEFRSAGAIAALAAQWERLGYAAAYVTDHPAPDDRWVAAGGHHALEPTVALAVAASSTSTLRLHTNVYVLGYRNPFLAAKALTSLDVVSDGRLILGVAVGYLRTEFEAVGAPFNGRGDLLEERLREVVAIMSGGPQQVGSRTVTPEPLPVQRPHPPIWVGGNSAAARRRAVRHGQVWSPFPTPGSLAEVTGTSRIADHDDLARAITELAEVSDAAGRAEPPEVAFVPFGLPAYLADPDAHLDELVDEVDALRALGVRWTVLAPAGASRAEVVPRATELAEALGLRSPVALG